MMSATRCQEHGDLWSQLVRGGLASEEASRAGTLLERCPKCASALQAEKEQPYYSTVDIGVRSGIHDFTPPGLKRPEILQERLILAAALILVAGVLLFGGSEKGPVGRRSLPDQGIELSAETTAALEVVSKEGFENPNLIFAVGNDDSAFIIAKESSSPATANHVQEVAPSLFADGLETGDAGRWKVNS
jgi:hypothetical protein